MVQNDRKKTIIYTGGTEANQYGEHFNRFLGSKRILRHVSSLERAWRGETVDEKHKHLYLDAVESGIKGPDDIAIVVLRDIRMPKTIFESCVYLALKKIMPAEDRAKMLNRNAEISPGDAINVLTTLEKEIELGKYLLECMETNVHLKDVLNSNKTTTKLPSRARIPNVFKYCVCCNKQLHTLTEVSCHFTKSNDEHLQKWYLNREFQYNSRGQPRLENLVTSEPIGKSVPAKPKKGKGNVQCDLCPVTVRDAGKLTQHKNAVHLKLKPFDCNQCGKKFSLKSNMQHHMKTVHSDVRAFKCNLCDYRSKSAEHLRLHKNMHKRHDLIGHKKTSKCDICGKMFKKSAYQHTCEKSMHDVDV